MTPDGIPTMLFVQVRDLDRGQARLLAEMATRIAIREAPKLSGASSARFEPVFGPGYFGIGWSDSHVWFQNQGTRPHTQRALAGKVVPMWIDDPTGEERKKNPRAKTRVTASGKTQVLIIRRAAKLGARKRVRRNGIMVTVPASYPGAPGRIDRREAARPFTTPGKVGGRIAQGNNPIRWRHPGLDRRGFLHQGINAAARSQGIFLVPQMVQAA